MNYSDKLKELEAKHQALSLEIEALKGLKDKEFPQEGDTYWFVDCYKVDFLHFNDDSGDQVLISVGNFWQFKEQAEAELETRKVIAELKKCRGVKKFVNGEMNYIVSYSFSSQQLYSERRSDTPIGIFQVYFESEEAVGQAIEQVGKDRIIKAIKWLACGEY